MTSDPQTHCEDGVFAALIARLGDGGGVDAVEPLLRRYPEDPRLHFLLGSVLAADRRYPEAERAMGAALARAPDMAIARFQLGLLQFTSGGVEQARGIWAALDGQAGGEALRLFAQGALMIADGAAAEGAAMVERGLAANETNPALNQNMRLLVDAMTGAAEDRSPASPTSATDMLLRQFGLGGGS